MDKCISKREFYLKQLKFHQDNIEGFKHGIYENMNVDKRHTEILNIILKREEEEMENVIKRLEGSFEDDPY